MPGLLRRWDRPDQSGDPLSRVSFPSAVLLPESFRGGCSFGAEARACEARPSVSPAGRCVRILGPPSPESRRESRALIHRNGQSALRPVSVVLEFLGAELQADDDPVLLGRSALG